MPPMTHLQQSSQPSQTGTTQVETTPATQSESHTPVLRLRGAHARDGRSVRWTADVVNNEGLGRKKSKGELAQSTLPRRAVVAKTRISSAKRNTPQKSDCRLTPLCWCRQLAA